MLMCMYVCLSADFSVLGIILHYDTSDLCDYYFIDPHWLYDVFCLICTPSVLSRNNISCEWSYIETFAWPMYVCMYRIITA